MDLRHSCYVIFLIVISRSHGYKDYYHLGGGDKHPTRDSRITTRSVCGNVPGLTQKQLALCIEDPHAVASAIQGLHVGIHECKRQFKDHRWNCSSLETKNNMPLNSAFLKRAAGNKESSFAYAITAAGVAHQVAHACSLGKIHDCHCPLSAGRRKKIRERFSAVDRFKYFGCNHNINYALNYSVRFLDPEAAKDQTSIFRQHNNRVGRLIVGKNMQETCRCHGTSGSCNQATCWYQTPNFREVGGIIKRKYNSARLFQENMSTSNNVRPNTPTPTTSNEALLYYEESPSYCYPNHKIAVAGTKGRICNSNAPDNDPSSCNHMCCRRGHRTYREVRHEKCHCRFHWCCYVECQNCTVSEEVSVCR